MSSPLLTIFLECNQNNSGDVHLADEKLLWICFEAVLLDGSTRTKWSVSTNVNTVNNMCLDPENEFYRACGMFHGL